MKRHSTILPTFEVDKQGLRKVLARKGMSWILPELLQNAWDENATEVVVQVGWLKPPAKRKGATGLAFISVEDNDPDGFKDISHAFTLFAESEKKDKAEKRGRFNVGEKLVVSMCERAEISTTTGHVIFSEHGREMLPAERDFGSAFYGEVKMTRPEFDEALARTKIMFAPANVETTINDEPLVTRIPVREFKATLRTPLGETLRLTERATTVTLYQPYPGETAHLYEMGIPIVALQEGGDRFHIDVGQKVPLNMDRDNVTPAYLRTIRRTVLDASHDLLTADDAATDWTTDAIQDKHVSPEGLKQLLTLRFGEKHVSYDISDQEANKIAVSQGYTLVHGGHLPKAAWVNVKAAGLIQPAGQVTPSPKPYKPGQGSTRATLPQEQWTAGMKNVAFAACEIAHKLLNATIKIEIVNDAQCMNFLATYGRGPGNTGMMEFNLRTLGRAWFEKPIDAKAVSLIIHELGHHIESDHLSRRYFDALTDLGAELAFAVADDPAWFAEITKEVTA